MKKKINYLQVVNEIELEDIKQTMEDPDFITALRGYSVYTRNIKKSMCDRSLLVLAEHSHDKNGEFVLEVRTWNWIEPIGRTTTTDTKEWLVIQGGKRL